MVSLMKLICAAYWPVNGEEALLWAGGQSGAPLGQVDVFSAFIARSLVETGPLRLLLLRLPGILATTLCLWPLLVLAHLLGRNGRVACNAWLVLHCLPGVCMASLGWNREGLLLLVCLGSAAAGLAGARGSRLGATLLGWIAGLSLLVHPIAPLGAACALAWPMEGGGPTPATPRWRVLQGLLPAILLVGLLDGAAVWERLLHFSASLHMGIDFPALGAFGLDALLWTGFVFLFLVVRNWSELQRKQFQGAITLRVAALAPLIVLFYLGFQGPVDGRLALGPLVVAFLPGLMSPDLPTSLRHKMARISGALTLGLMATTLTATWLPALGVPLAKLAPKWIERSPAARPTTRAMLPELEQRVSPGTAIAGEDPLQAALFSFLGTAIGNPISTDRTRPLPSTALILLGKPGKLETAPPPYSTIEALPSVRVQVPGQEDQVLWIALARDPQATSQLP